jgi:hypothetical protein
MQGVLSYEFGPDDRYYLVGLITHTDLNIRNLCGFDTLDQAGAIAKSFGYELAWVLNNGSDTQGGEVNYLPLLV